MILGSKDLKGSMMDQDELWEKYDENLVSFRTEFKALQNRDPANHRWMNALSLFKIYKGAEGYRVAIPKEFLPEEITDYPCFEGFLLSRTVFPNALQAGQIASRLIQQSTCD